MDGWALNDEVALGLTAAYARLSRLIVWQEGDAGKRVAVQVFIQRLESVYAAYQQAAWNVALERLIDARNALNDLASDAPD